MDNLTMGILGSVIGGIILVPIMAHLAEKSRIKKYIYDKLLEARNALFIIKQKAKINLAYYKNGGFQETKNRNDDSDIIFDEIDKCVRTIFNLNIEKNSFEDDLDVMIGRTRSLFWVFAPFLKEKIINGNSRHFEEVFGIIDKQEINRLRACGCDCPEIFVSGKIGSGFWGDIRLSSFLLDIIINLCDNYRQHNEIFERQKDFDKDFAKSITDSLNKRIQKLLDAIDNHQKHLEEKLKRFYGFDKWFDLFLEKLDSAFLKYIWKANNL